MGQMLVSDLLQALDLVGDAYRSSDGKKPADAVLKVKAKLVGYNTSTVAEWVSAMRLQASAKGDANQSESSKSPRKQKAAAPTDQQLLEILAQLVNVAMARGSASSFEELERLQLSAADWKRLAKLAGQKASNKDQAKLALRGYLAGKSQSNLRGENIAAVFN